ncbi:MAG: HPt (histidine-containing phosphotransfer) domain-containing protein [bacterium]|jgi:HPt (histidine-containing phosphotransfer) domain-containing protein
MSLSKDAVLADILFSAESMGLDLEDLLSMIPDVLEDAEGKIKILNDETVSLADQEKIKSIAHDLKGTFLNYGLNKLGEVAKYIENEPESAENGARAKELEELLSDVKAMNLA